MTEKSKLFRAMGKSLGIKDPRKSHRGYSARQYMQRVEAYELSEFGKALVDMTPRSSGVPIREHGEVIGYL